MITKIYKSFVFSVAMFGLSSCVNNWLDQAPSNGIPTSQAITNYNDARTAMYGMYDGVILHIVNIMLPECFTMAMYVLMICRPEIRGCVLLRVMR